MIALRPYQERALDDVRALIRSGKRRVAIVSPTGSGKTILIAVIASGHVVRGGRVLIIVHRRELIAQTVKKLARAGLDRVGVIASGEPSDVDAPVQVASIQTLLARGELPDASLVILDECHHYVSDEWGTVGKRYADALLVGVTATPERGDGEPLGDLFDAMVVVASIHELVAAGFLVPCDVIAPARQTKTLCEDPVEAWKSHAGDRPGVVFAGSVDAARDLADRFTAEGIAAASVDGKTTAADRDERLAQFERGELQVLTNCFVLTEGWDCPRAEICMIARGCAATGTYLQMIGRVLRPAPGKASARLIDLRGVVHVHGLPDHERTFSLEGRAISGGGEAPLKTCPECARTMAIAIRTCECGHEFRPAECQPDLAPLSRIERSVIERAHFAALAEEARMRGFKAGWVVHRFKQRFGDRFPAKLWREFFPRQAVAA